MKRPSPLFLRLFAALCTGLVLLLGVVAADERLHARIHATTAADCGHPHDHPAPASDPDHAATCAVDLFAGGISLPVDPTHVVVDPVARPSSCFPTVDEVLVASAPHIHPPGRGPPQG